MNSSNTRLFHCWMSFPKWILLAAEDPPFSFVPREGFWSSILCAEWKKWMELKWMEFEWSGTISKMPEDSRICWELGIGSHQARQELVEKSPKPVLKCWPADPPLLYISEHQRANEIKKHQTTRKHSGFKHAWRVLMEVGRPALIGKADCRYARKQLNTGLKQRRRNLEYHYQNTYACPCLSIVGLRQSFSFAPS